ncbi:hypothetical protein [Tritonibacter scottomollicae]|uniref:hypothetical protein n=1 Tax=Tritonibacter scottomollicae TaxID=483013 RepID=UPI003AA928AC
MQEKQLILPEAWRPNQKVVLSQRKPEVLGVMRGQPGSTPGIVAPVNVKKGTRYIFEVELVGNCPIRFYLADSKRKEIPLDVVEIPRNRSQKNSMSFVANETGQVWVGLLIRNSKLETRAQSGDYFELQSASLSSVPSSSGAVASLATMPSRISSLPATLASILDQVEHVFIHLNEFNEVPEFLKRPEITVTRSQQFGNLRDTGKFVGLREVPDDTLFFTIDDDIIYPSNYVTQMTAALDRFDRRAAVGVHGIIFPRKPRSFFDRLAVHFKSSLSVDLPVSCLGTGTTACRAGTLRPEIEDFEQHGMADLYFAGLAKRAGVPLVSVARRSDWLYDALDPGEQNNTLYQETRSNNSPHNKVLKQYGPWGFAEIEKSVAQVSVASGKDPLSAEARAFVNYGLWLERACTGARVDVPLTENAVSLAHTLKLPDFLREAMFSKG